MSLIYQFLFDREDYRRTSPPVTCRLRGRKPKNLAGPPSPDSRRQLLLFIETAGGILIPACPAGPKRPGRRAKVKLKKAPKIPKAEKSKRLVKIEELANKPCDELTPAQMKLLDDHFKQQIAERSQQVQRSWTPEEEAERNMIPAVRVEWNPTIIREDN